MSPDPFLPLWLVNGQLHETSIGLIIMYLTLLRIITWKLFPNCFLLFDIYCSPLAHTLYPVESTEMCLITKSEKSDVKELLEEKKVCGVTKVLHLPFILLLWDC